MSDDFNTFIAKTDAMLALAEKQTRAITQQWLVNCGDEVVRITPGPDNQHPEVEHYIATGRLRMGYRWDYSAPTMTPANRTLPVYDDSTGGVVAQGVQAARVKALELGPMMTLWNAVGYGWYPHFGRGHGHEKWGARPWTYDFAASNYTQTALNLAVAEVMTGAL